MQVILLERIGRLGQMGDVVKVKDGYARNFLLPQGKALRATDENKGRFDKDRAQLEARNLELKKEAEVVAAKLAGQEFVTIRQAGDTGQLYGSVSPRDIAEVVTEGGFSVDRRQILLDRPIKALGVHPVQVVLHPELWSGCRLTLRARSPRLSVSRAARTSRWCARKRWRSKPSIPMRFSRASARPRPRANPPRTTPKAEFPDSGTGCIEHAVRLHTKLQITPARQALASAYAFRIFFNIGVLPARARQGGGRVCVEVGYVQAARLYAAPNCGSRQFDLHYQ